MSSGASHSLWGSTSTPGPTSSLANRRASFGCRRSMGEPSNCPATNPLRMTPIGSEGTRRLVGSRRVFPNLARALSFESAVEATRRSPTMLAKRLPTPPPQTQLTLHCGFRPEVRRPPFGPASGPKRNVDSNSPGSPTPSLRCTLGEVGRRGCPTPCRLRSEENGCFGDFKSGASSHSRM